MKTFLTLLFLQYSIVCFSQYDLEPVQKKIDKRSNEKTELEKKYNCQFIPLYQYKIGMKFFFPKIEETSSDRLEYYNYKKILVDKKGRVTKSSITYSEIESKVFEITKIKEETEYGITETVFWLKELNGDFTIESRVHYSLAKLEKQDKEIYGQLTELPDAIFAEEIDNFKTKYLNESFFANFPINGIKFQKVKIIQVGAGSDIFPIRAIVQNEAGELETKDFNTCGTNVTRVITDKTNFDVYFSIENPKTKYNIPDKIWNQIIESKIGLGFSKKQLILAWGEPKQINKTITNNVISEQYVYDKQYVYLEKDIVSSIQDTK